MQNQTLIFLSTPNSRGIDKVAHNLASSIQNASIYSPNLFPQHPFFLLLAELLLYPLVSLLKNPKCIIFVNSRISPFFALLLRQRKLLYIHDLVNTNIPPFSRFNQYTLVPTLINTIFIKVSLTIADIVLTNSKTTLDSVSNAFPAYNNLSYVSYPLPSFSPHDLIHALRMETDSKPPSSAFKLLIVTGTSPNKGLNNYCTFLTLLQSLTNQNISIDIVGVESSSGYARQISQATSHTTHFHYHLSNVDLCSLFLNTNLFVSLSLFEGFGIPLLDSKCFGIPSILSDIDVYREQHELFPSQTLFLPSHLTPNTLSQHKSKARAFISSCQLHSTSATIRSAIYLQHLKRLTLQHITHLKPAVGVS